jgi:hypothetical protein
VLFKAVCNCLRCDGDPRAKDFVVSDAVQELAQMIEDFMEYLECD